jgi:hypothetical protein
LHIYDRVRVKDYSGDEFVVAALFKRNKRFYCLVIARGGDEDTKFKLRQFPLSCIQSADTAPLDEQESNQLRDRILQALREWQESKKKKPQNKPISLRPNSLRSAALPPPRDFDDHDDDDDNDNDDDEYNEYFVVQPKRKRNKKAVPIKTRSSSSLSSSSSSASTRVAKRKRRTHVRQSSSRFDSV